MGAIEDRPLGAIVGLLGCGAYCAGLLLVSLLVRHGGMAVWSGVAIAGVTGLIIAGFAALLLPRYWRTGPGSLLWLSLGAISLIAILNYGGQYPTPSPLDVSRWLQQGEAAGAQQEVWGWVEEMPKIARSGKGQFWLKTDQIRRRDQDNISLGMAERTQGKLYITVPAQAIQGLYPGQRVKVQGKLYAPTPPKNPNAFNFQQYLNNHHCYAGFSGKWVDPDPGSSPPWWGLWRLRQRIAQAHAVGLGERAGALVSAMALGRKAVQVPYDLQDTFIQAGLAHTLAASGFHVSLVLGLVLGIMSQPVILARCANPGVAKLVAGGIALTGYVLLTGGQPSVMRASLMGVGALVGLALERSVQPLGCLLLVVTLLLLWNPTWIDDIGFRLSVMATFGLIVGVKPLTERLEGLPTTVATLAAVPLAAYFWTIPLSLYYFNTLTTYSILLNMVVTPLVTVISLGGIFSGLVALLSPGLGSLLAWILWLPTHLLIELVNWETSLPGSALATGHISLLQMFGLYGLFCLGCWHLWWRSRRWLVAVLLVLVAMGPLWYRAATLAEVTVLATGQDAVMVVQDHRSTLLVNSGTDKTAFYTVVPFLRQAGINRLTYAVGGVDSDRDNWQTIIAKAPIRNFYGVSPQLDPPFNLRRRYDLMPGVSATLGRQTVTALSNQAQVLRWTLLGTHDWIMLSGQSQADQKRLNQTHGALKSEVLWWDGGELSQEMVAAVQPRVAIASATRIDPITEQHLLAQGIQVFCTERDGAILWNPRQGYRAYLASTSSQRVTLD
jgi:competence protein ComEC